MTTAPRFQSGQMCARCDEAIGHNDNGFMQLHLEADQNIYRPYHYACLMRSIIGGLNHLKDRCTCCGGTEPPDPPEMTKREAAEAAVAFYERRPE